MRGARQAGDEERDELQKEQEEDFGGDEYALYLDCDDDSVGVYVFVDLTNCTV